MISSALALSLMQSAPDATIALHATPPLLVDALFWFAAAACGIAQYFIVRAVWKVIPSGISSPDVPVPRRTTEIVWVLLPVLLLVGAFVGTWRHLHPPIAASAAIEPSATRS